MAANHRMQRNDLTDLVDRLLVDWSRERPDLDSQGKAIVYSIFILESLFSRDADKILCRWNLNFASYGVLATLRRSGEPYEAKPSEIARVLGLTSGGVSNILKKLEDLGYIARSPNRHDRRGVLVRLTQSGLATVDVAATEVTNQQSERLRALTKRERERLRQLLRTAILAFRS